MSTTARQIAALVDLITPTSTIGHTGDLIDSTTCQIAALVDLITPTSTVGHTGDLIGFTIEGGRHR